MAVLACQNKSSNHSGKQDSISAVYKKPASSFNDTLTVKGAAAVFFQPDTQQLQRIALVRKKMDFESDKHDCFFQMQNARKLISQYWRRVQTIETAKARFLLFVHDDGVQTIIDLNTKNDMCGIFLFDGKQQPYFPDMMNIDTALDYYFKK